MALANYSDLKTTVANYLGRSDLTSQIPDFISLAEIRLNRNLRIRQMLKNATASTTGGDPTVGLPSDFLELRDIYIAGNPRITLSYLSPSAFSRDARADQSGRPVFYTMSGAEFVLAPLPDTTYTLTMLYYAKPTALSDANPSNVFMANAADCLLYGALLEAEPYLMNDARLAVWSQLFGNSIETLNSSDDSSEYAGIPLTMSVTSR
jgi:hypothetical protein